MAKKKPEQIYVGRKNNGSFVRTHEELDGDDYAYGIFTSNKKLSKKNCGFYDLIIGPFRTMKGAEIFRDREGVNTVEEAERLVNA